MPSYDPIPENIMPRFAGTTTFMKLPDISLVHCPDITVMGAPFDGGTTMKSGARMGPKAIRDASRGLFPYHRIHRIFLTENIKICDGGDLRVIPSNVPKTLDIMARQIEQISEHSLVLLLGGDHSVSLSALRALAKRTGPVSLIHFDAHSDLWHESWGELYSHATVFRRAIEESLINPYTSIQVGLRGGLDNANEDNFGHELHIQQITTEDWFRHGDEWVTTQIYQRVGNTLAYVTVDIDVVDPAFASGTGTPEAGGPSSYMVLHVLRSIRSLVIGGDVVELAPCLDLTQSSSLFAATVAYEILFLLAQSCLLEKTKESV
ncbi:agmatinase [Sulfobacillus thermosulfidooxidans]|uniref:agmatinase n=1 Tax=Sulfobacillus thermosulfidooxidans TaxID=28034 RepID=UPI000367D08F|nr:agmatinase [Sulfobacillus thermosulfidooxidans]